MRNNLSAKIKSVLNKNGVKSQVSTYGSTITVKVLSPISAELCDTIKSMETIEAHGDSMNDTRHYSGLSIQFNYAWEPSASEIANAAELFNSWSDESKADRVSFRWRFKKQLIEKLGPVGHILFNRF